jgi:hypothetical protein
LTSKAGFGAVRPGNRAVITGDVLEAHGHLAASGVVDTEEEEHDRLAVGVVACVLGQGAQALAREPF